jgi:hypothetical protein
MYKVQGDSGCVWFFRTARLQLGRDSKVETDRRKRGKSESSSNDDSSDSDSSIARRRRHRRSTTTPIEFIIRNSNDAEIVGMIERQNVSTHEQVRLMCAANAISANQDDLEINRIELVTWLVDKNPSNALLAMENTFNSVPNNILKRLEQHHQLAELNSIARCGEFRSRTLENDLDEMLYVVLQLAQKQFKTSVVNFLNAGEEGSLPGFVNVTDSHLLKEKSTSAFIPSWMQRTQDIPVPLSELLGPRTFNTANVSEAWGDLKKDKREQIQVKIIRRCQHD